MATSANLPPGAMPVDESRNESDPFTTQPNETQRQRYSGFDNHLFSLYSNGSPSQAKRALEAHLSETERRLQETSKLGTVLVEQRKELAERLREVDGQQQQDEIDPLLKRKLLELEKEVNEVSRETARAFIAKNRVPSGESTDSTVNASVFSSDAHYSPSKVQAPSRKQRNQQPSRVNDLKLATEISTSLLAQVRDLQAAVAEKDQALKSVTTDRTQLELDFESLRQRLRALDESEQRFKDENWSLETQLHELTASHKESADREQRLAHNLTTAKSEKAALERDFEELKQAHGKLVEDHTAARRHHEAELGTFKRGAVADESEKATLQKRVDELTAQNKELAQAVAYRLRDQSRSVSAESGYDGEDIQEDAVTPENSPPGSPSKATPRHGPLHAETLQSSLNHAHRTIQNLRNQLHREKTEKIEYRRLLQDAREEIEAKRSGMDSGKKRKSGKDQDILKKTTRPDRLGAARESREDIILDDPDWEDHEGQETPSKTRGAVIASNSAGNRNSVVDTSTDAYVTATENSDTFETAHERDASATETDAFQTGAETLDGDSSDDLTETESGPALKNAPRKRPTPITQDSYQSTASTSGDDFDEYDLRTPVQQTQQPKYKLRISRGGQRRISARSSSEALQGKAADFRDSPTSIKSNSSTPAPPGQSLFAELGNLSDAETDEGTPKSVSILSQTNSPEILKRSPAPSRLRTTELSGEKRDRVMIDSGMMTEPWEPESKGVSSNATEVVGAALAGGIGFGIGRSSKPSTEDSNAKEVKASIQGAKGDKEIVNVIVPEESYAVVGASQLSISSTLSQNTEPASPGLQETPPVPLGTSTILSQHVEPVEPEHLIPQPLVHSHVVSQDTEPTAIPEQSVRNADVSAVPLSLSSIIQLETEPANPPRPATAIMVDRGNSVGSTSTSPERGSAETQAKSGFGFFGTMLRRKNPTGEAAVAEDETSQLHQLPSNMEAIAPSPKADAAVVDTRMPFRQIDGNAPSSPERVAAKESDKFDPNQIPLRTANEGTQTVLSAEEIDRLFRAKGPTASEPQTSKAFASPSKGIYSSASPRKSRESVTTVERVQRRPGSAGSVRSRTSTPPPPLPMEARQAIERAAQKTPGTTPVPQLGSMGPPIAPASAFRTSQIYRPRTPVNVAPLPSPTLKGVSTVRASMSTTGARSGMASPATTRRSSVSSFASELDHRFNITRSNMDGQYYDPNITDPRMIQAITQTMIGEYLWKYTRKAGREEMSTSRHRRFFWVHPYTRTLYWSDQDPSTAGKAQLKAKSVAIEAVRVVTDDNPMPPGIHRKSLIVITPGRSIKFTAPTSQRHETWFNSLSYLLLRTGAEREDEGGMTTEDVEEFNPGYVRSSSRMTGRSRASVSSYVSRATVRTVSPQRQHPTLRAPSRASQRSHQSQSIQPQASFSGRLSSLGGVFKSTQSVRGSFSSRHSRQSMAQEAALYDKEASDSAEDLRAVIEAQERDADRLENVRACCDGKHDVGSLSRTSRHSKSISQSQLRPQSQKSRAE